jgi:hypothetical protein
VNRTFESWELQARVALADQGIGHRVVDPLIEHAKADCEESGQTPWEAIGSPEEFAATVATEHPRAQESFGKALGGTVFAVAGLTIPAAIFAAIRAGSFSFPVTAAGLTGSVMLFAALVMAFGVGPQLRERGFLRLANACWGATFLLVLATATAFVQLPRTAFTTVPVIAVIGGALLLMWLLARGQGEDEPEEPLDSATEGRVEDAAAWFTRLNGLLIGRHDLPPARAEELVAEARAHLADSAEKAPAAEFGPVATYAAELAEHEPLRQPPWWRNPTLMMVFWSIDVPVTVWLTWLRFDEDGVLALVIGIPATIACALWAVENWRLHRTARARAT